MKFCIRNGRVINPLTGFDKVADVIIEKGMVTDVIDASVTSRNYDKIIDATNMFVIPGLVDMHVHMRDPGFTYKEDIKTGAKSAAAGGFTTVCQMPNTKPCIDNNKILKYINEKIKEKSIIEILTVGAITKGQEGKELTNFASLKNESTGGICALSEDGKSVMNTSLMMEAMKKAKEKNLLITDHCEDRNLFLGGAMNDGEISRILGFKGIPTATEDIITIRDIILSQYTGCPLHLCHVSTKNCVEFIKWAKSQGIKVTAETCPHYFTFTDNDVIINGKANTNFKMNPPLRSEEDRLAILNAVCDGTIDIIVTDHAPHSNEEKQQEFSKAPFGVVGLETSLAASYTQLVKTGLMKPIDLIDSMSASPAKILGIKRGSVEKGGLADITIFDPNEEWTVDSNKFFTKGRYTPFNGKKLFGRVKMTVKSGKIVYERD